MSDIESKPESEAEAPKTLSPGLSIFILISVMVLMIFIVVKCQDGPSPRRSTAPPPPPAAAPKKTAKAWYIGGTLHKKTGADWLAATTANRLATAADMAITFKDKFGLENMTSMDELKGPAIQMMTCLDEAFKGDPSQEVSAIGAMCMILLTSK